MCSTFYNHCLRVCCLLSATFCSGQSLRINELLASNHAIIADDAGDFDDWVEIYNPGKEAVNLSGYFVSDNPSVPLKWQIPSDTSFSTVVPPGGFLLLWFDDEPEEGATHLPFKLNAAGENILISAPDSTLLDSVHFEQQVTDISLARQPDGTGDWIICSTPTPGISNLFAIGIPITDLPLASVSSGRYDQPFQLSFSSTTPNGAIRLSFDGTVPDESDSLFVQPIDIQETTIVRARVFAPDYQPGNTASNTYLFIEPHHFPVISLVFDPGDFFDTLTGVYTHPESFSDIEVPAHATWIETDGSAGFSYDLAVELFGNGSLSLPQKSLLLQAKLATGAQEIEYQLFPELPENKYKSLVLRNSGQDWCVTMFRDAMVGSLGRDITDVKPVLGELPLTFQGFRPAVVYLNGQYWGIHNVREQQNERFIQHHFEASDDAFDFIEFYGTALEGDSLEWQSFWQWITDNHFQSDLKFSELEEKNDMSNFTDYCIFQIVTDNVDWPGKNWRRFKSHQPGSRWQWLPFDFDLSFGLLNTDFTWNTGFAGQNAFARAIDSTFSFWATADWQTVILRRSLENQHYKEHFINRTADLLNTVFDSNRMLARIDSFENMYLPEIEQHFERWYFSPGWLPYWKDNVQKMKDFAALRPDYCFEQVTETFPEADTVATVNLAVYPPEAGKLLFSTLHFDSIQLPWQGRYFTNIPIPVKAIAKPGWAFSGWSEPELGTSDSISLLLTGDLNLTAQFIPEEVPVSTHAAAANNFYLSPNPAGRTTQVTSPVPMQSILLYNSMGVLQKALSFESNGTSSTWVQLDGLPSGIYWVQVVFNSGKKAIRRLIKH